MGAFNRHNIRVCLARVTWGGLFNGLSWVALFAAPDGGFDRHRVLCANALFRSVKSFYNGRDNFDVLSIITLNSKTNVPTPISSIISLVFPLPLPPTVILRWCFFYVFHTWFSTAPGLLPVSLSHNDGEYYGHKLELRWQWFGISCLGALPTEYLVPQC